MGVHSGIDLVSYGIRWDGVANGEPHKVNTLFASYPCTKQRAAGATCTMSDG